MGGKITNEYSFDYLGSHRHSDHWVEISCILVKFGFSTDSPCPDYHCSYYAISMGFVGGY
tara:strand:- start:221 stop:400 length:180 start_codon:yes stop_codon:yes gene_type:complete